LLLHICRCAEPMPMPAAPACCAEASPAAEPAGCCSHGALAAPGAELPDQPPSAHARDCGCVWVPLTEDQPEPTRPDAPPLALVEAPRPAELLLAPPTEPVGPSTVHAARSRPPPDHQRSLPLRL
jgi:hypothetical protein